MDSVNNLSETSAKLPGVAASFLASLSASLASGDAVDGMFANFLSQIQMEPPPPPDPAANAQTSSLPASQSSQQSVQDTGTNGPTDPATTSASSPSDKTTPVPPGWSLIGKPQRHDAKSTPDKSKSDDTAKNQSNPPASSPPAPASNIQTNVSNNTPAVTTPAVTPNEPNDATAADSDPGNTTVPDADLTQATNGQPSTVPTAADAPAADTSPSSNGSDNTAGAANNDVPTSQLMLLLMQLGHLAAGRLAGTTAAAASDPANAAGVQGTTAAQVQPAPGTTGDAKGKIDLKALLAQLNGQNNADVAGDGTAGQAGSTGAAGNTQNTTAAASAATTASLQNTLQASATASSSATVDDKWMNASFLNLFNAATNNQNTTGVPLIVNPTSAAELTTAGSDGAALDADMQGEGGTNTHNAAANIQTLGTNLTPAPGPSQSASPYDFASQLSALRAAKGGPTGLPTPVEQVMLQLSRGVSKDGSSQMTIQLRPAELGRVDVKLNIGSDGKVQGTVTAENPTTLGLLLKDVRGLERALQEAGLRADSGSLQFNLRGDGQSGGSGGQASDNNPSGFANNASTSSGSTTSLPAFADPADTYYLTPGGVNFRV